MDVTMASSIPAKILNDNHVFKACEFPSEEVLDTLPMKILDYLRALASEDPDSLMCGETLNEPQNVNPQAQGDSVTPLKSYFAFPSPIKFGEITPVMPRMIGKGDALSPWGTPLKFQLAVNSPFKDFQTFQRHRVDSIDSMADLE
jgi:hypothetical protein